ncbi:hypothetical protein BSLG_002562 [Batrachochytrium salamandrivorans]|nr:hypothetical protein BSLG_002562 [Batrachochytrium salamandrivorans]
MLDKHRLQSASHIPRPSKFILDEIPAKYMLYKKYTKRSALGKENGRAAPRVDDQTEMLDGIEYQILILLYGHPSGLAYRYISEYASHVFWLSKEPASQNERRNYSDCLCAHCQQFVKSCRKLYMDFTRPTKKEHYLVLPKRLPFGPSALFRNGETIWVPIIFRKDGKAESGIPLLEHMANNGKSHTNSDSSFHKDTSKDPSSSTSTALSRKGDAEPHVNTSVQNTSAIHDPEFDQLVYFPAVVTMRSTDLVENRVPIVHSDKAINLTSLSQASSQSTTASSSTVVSVNYRVSIQTLDIAMNVTHQSAYPYVAHPVSNTKHLTEKQQTWYNDAIAVHTYQASVLAPFGKSMIKITSTDLLLRLSEAFGTQLPALNEDTIQIPKFDGLRFGAEVIRIGDAIRLKRADPDGNLVCMVLGCIFDVSSIVKQHPGLPNIVVSGKLFSRQEKFFVTLRDHMTTFNAWFPANKPRSSSRINLEELYPIELIAGRFYPVRSSSIAFDDDRGIAQSYWQDWHTVDGNLPQSFMPIKHTDSLLNDRKDVRDIFGVDDRDVLQPTDVTSPMKSKAKKHKTKLEMRVAKRRKKKKMELPIVRSRTGSIDISGEGVTDPNPQSALLFLQQSSTATPSKKEGLLEFSDSDDNDNDDDGQVHEDDLSDAHESDSYIDISTLNGGHAFMERNRSTLPSDNDVVPDQIEIVLHSSAPIVPISQSRRTSVEGNTSRKVAYASESNSSPMDLPKATPRKLSPDIKSSLQQPLLLVSVKNAVDAETGVKTEQAQALPERTNDHHQLPWDNSGVLPLPRVFDTKVLDKAEALGDEISIITISDTVVDCEDVASRAVTLAATNDPVVSPHLPQTSISATPTHPLSLTKFSSKTTGGTNDHPTIESRLGGIASRPLLQGARSLDQDVDVTRRQSSCVHDQQESNAEKMEVDCQIISSGSDHDNTESEKDPHPYMTGSSSALPRTNNQSIFSRLGKPPIHDASGKADQPHSQPSAFDQSSTTKEARSSHHSLSGYMPSNSTSPPSITNRLGRYIREKTTLSSNSGNGGSLHSPLRRNEEEKADSARISARASVEQEALFTPSSTRSTSYRRSRSPPTVSPTSGRSRDIQIDATRPYKRCNSTAAPSISQRGEALASPSSGILNSKRKASVERIPAYSKTHADHTVTKGSSPDPKLAGSSSISLRSSPGPSRIGSGSVDQEARMSHSTFTRSLGPKGASAAIPVNPERAARSSALRDSTGDRPHKSEDRRLGQGSVESPYRRLSILPQQRLSSLRSAASPREIHGGTQSSASHSVTQSHPSDLPLKVISSSSKSATHASDTGGQSSVHKVPLGEPHSTRMPLSSHNKVNGHRSGPATPGPTILPTSGGRYNMANSQHSSASAAAAAALLSPRHELPTDKRPKDLQSRASENEASRFKGRLAIDSGDNSDINDISTFGNPVVGGRNVSTLANIPVHDTAPIADKTLQNADAVVTIGRGITHAQSGNAALFSVVWPELHSADMTAPYKQNARSILPKDGKVRITTQANLVVYFSIAYRKVGVFKGSTRLLNRIQAESPMTVFKFIQRGIVDTITRDLIYDGRFLRPSCDADSRCPQLLKLDCPLNSDGAEDHEAGLSLKKLHAALHTQVGLLRGRRFDGLVFATIRDVMLLVTEKPKSITDWYPVLLKYYFQ